MTQIFQLQRTLQLLKFQKIINMDVRKIGQFFKSKLGIFTLFAVALVFGLIFLGNWKSSIDKGKESQGANTKPLSDGIKMEQPITTIDRKVANIPPSKIPKSTTITNQSPSQARQETNIVYETITPFGHYLPSTNTTPQIKGRVFSDQYAPFGRLIKCTLVNTLDSSSIQTPIIALVTDDVFFNGNLVIPAGSEVHGSATTDTVRERITSGGQWVIVLPGDGERPNGSELLVSGAALDQDQPNPQIDSWTITDGSYGIKGEILRDDNLHYVKLFAAEFLGAGAGAWSKAVTTTTPLGGTVQSREGGFEDAISKGLEASITEYANQIRQEIERNGFYVRVRAGTDFYLYVTQTMDPTEAKVGASDTLAKDIIGKKEEPDPNRINQFAITPNYQSSQQLLMQRELEYQKRLQNSRIIPNDPR